MIVNKIQFYPQGNFTFSNFDGTNDTAVKSFVTDTGAEMLEGNLIRVIRHNGSDFITFDWKKIKYLVGSSGSLALPTSKSAFYQMLFEEFIVPAKLASGSATEEKQQEQIDLMQEFATKSENQPVFNQNDYFTSVALGKITNAINFKKSGGNPVLSTTQRLIAYANNALYVIPAASQITFQSTQASDTVLGGTGAQKITIFGVDTDGAEQSEILELQGTTPVLSVKSYRYVLNRVIVSQAGTSLTNAGQITGTVGGNNVCTIPAGTSVMKQLCFFVPKGKTASIYSYFFDFSKNIGGTQKVDLFFYVLQNGVRYELFNFRVDQATGSDVFIPRLFQSPIPIPNLCLWYVEGKTDSGTCNVDGEIEQILNTN